MRRALPRRLPRIVAPAHHEIIASYLGRLATLNHVDGDELWKSVSVPGPTPARRVVTAERLSALTCRPAEHLAGALPELRATTQHWPLFRHQPQPGCPRCDARHPGGPVRRILPHHRYVCTRHHHWIGPPDNDTHGPSLRGNREVIAAQRKHLHLVRRVGPGAAYDAVLTAFMICAHRWEILRPTSGLQRQQKIWRERSFQLMPAGAELSSFTASKLFACLYPEAIEFAPLIATPLWRQLAADGGDQRTRFVAEARRRLRDHDYQPQPEQDAIAHWIETDSGRPPATPPTTFAAAPGNRKPSQVGRTKQPSAERTARSAVWFAMKDRRGMGDAVLHHRTLRPVILREWSPDMQEYRGAIWNSQRTENSSNRSDQTSRSTKGDTMEYR
ncbi:hypothetical protein [Nocardia gipuzkoensis]|uniref:hypothetical protein n=1 Tax=Nocardia gipuzkoensis TaxID=2749991 RepID=UPI00237DACFD|nr:hypothetical protein [Nocardia gipuzkoensis]MDE1672674.1 hypothetical protein [Nocardia gipuzkoensis]